MRARAADVAEDKLRLAREHGLRHRLESTRGVFDGWVGRTRTRHRTSRRSRPTIWRSNASILLSSLPPEVHRHACLELDQGYLPGKEIRERVRRIRGPKGESFRRTIKAGRGVQRIEFEEPMDAPTFAQLWPLTEGSRVTKRRYIVPDGRFVWEIDEFTDRKLVLAEIELDAIDTKPILPDWLAPYVIRDVTDESGFVNQKLAC